MSTKLFLVSSLIGSLLTADLFSAAGAGDPSVPRMEGTWTWEFTMPDGAIASPKVTLRQDGETLTGSTGFRPGTEIAITEGRIRGDELSFEVVRERDGRKIVTRYSGRITGRTIRGRIESNWSGEWQTYDWTATRPLIPPNSVWNSLVLLPENQKQRWKMRFKQEHDKLTGGITTSSKQQLDIKNGKVEGDELSFEVERKRQNETDHFAYRGAVSGDSIKGTVRVTLKDEKHTLQWTAERPPRVIDGKWEWSHGGAKRELILKREGDELTGKFIMEGKHEYEIDQGRVTGAEVYFEVERERDAEKTRTKFRGTLGDDRIVGKTEFIMNDAAPQFEDWEADKVQPAETESDGNGSRPASGGSKARGQNKR